MEKKSGFESQRNRLYSLLGDLPPRNRPISSTLLKVDQTRRYVCEKLVLDLNGFQDVPAYFIKPKHEPSPFPTILYNHAHGGEYGLGKDELLEGSSLLQKPAYAQELTAAGYAVLCIDNWMFGERRGLTESELFKLMLWRGQVLWGMMVYDNLRAVDYLFSREDVNFKRIGTMGLSMGSTMSWWVAALDPRIQVCVDLCCLTDYQALIDTRGLDGHGIYYYVPSLTKYFTTAQINALIAPRPHLSLAGNYDPLTPAIGLDRIDREIKVVYSSMNASAAWQLKRYAVGHFETGLMRRDVMDFFQNWL